MGHDLEAPFEAGKPASARLYRARGEEVVSERPVFTGDVYDNVPLRGPTGEVRARAVMVLQHPCAMRVDGVSLAPKLLVAEVGNRRPLTVEAWQGNYSVMPLPDLRPDVDTGKRHQAASFDKLELVATGELTQRIASLSPFGVNLLLQRWVHYSSRVVVPTWQLHQTIEGEYEESDLIEDWCLDRDGVDLALASKECVEWLRDDAHQPTRQQRLKDAQERSSIRTEMRAELRRLRDQA